MAVSVRLAIDEPALERYLAAHVSAVSLPVTISQFSFGQSNPTYLLTDSTKQRYVLRKKPPGKLLSRTAHRVEREYRIMLALGSMDTDVPVPKMYCLCNDESVLGTPWYLMEYLDGRIFEDAVMPSVEPGERAAMWQDAIQTLAKFHAFNPAALGLDDFGHKGDFYDRQLVTWKKICDVQANTRDVETGVPVGPLPHMEELVHFFGQKHAGSKRPLDLSTLVHGDFKIDNLVFHRSEPRVIGIIE